LVLTPQMLQELGCVKQIIVARSHKTSVFAPRATLSQGRKCSQLDCPTTSQTLAVHHTSAASPAFLYLIPVLTVPIFKQKFQYVLRS